MAKTLLINPRRRKARRNPSAAQLRNRARFAAAARARSRVRSANPKRRRNPANYAPLMYATNPSTRRRRRRNPVGAIGRYVSRRRRRNPISLGGSSLSMKGVLDLAKEAAIMGGGAVAMDWLYSQVSKYLPANMQAGPGQVNLGSVVKMGITAALGIALNRTTKGLSKKAALGALTVQARDIVLTYVPASVSASVSGLGYMSPTPTFNRNFRINANRAGNVGMGAYIPGMRSPALNGMGRYAAMPTPLLNGVFRR